MLDGPYVPIHLPALLDHGLGTAVDDVLTRGRDVLTSTLGTPVDERTRLLRPASPSALGRLSIDGVDRVIVSGDALAPAPETRFTPAQPVTLTAPISLTDSAPVTALATDSGLQSILTSDLPAAQRVQLVLGGLARRRAREPRRSRGSTHAGQPRRVRRPGRRCTRDSSPDFAGNPYLRPVTTTEAFDTIPTDPPGDAAPTGRPGSSERELATAGHRRARDHLRSSTEPARPAELLRRTHPTR